MFFCLNPFRYDLKIWIDESFADNYFYFKVLSSLLQLYFSSIYSIDGKFVEYEGPIPLVCFTKGVMDSGICVDDEP